MLPHFIDFWVSVAPSILNSTPHAALFGSVGSLIFLPYLCGYYSGFLVAAATQEILSSRKQYTHTHIHTHPLVKTFVQMPFNLVDY